MTAPRPDAMKSGAIPTKKAMNGCCAEASISEGWDSPRATPPIVTMMLARTSE